jgi:polysaccharide biosynthesis protein PslG
MTRAPYPFVVLAVTAAVLVLLGAALVPDLALGAFYLTGEEQPLPQITGMLQLAFNLLRPPLQLADDVPVANTGINPYGVNTFLQNEVDPLKRRRAVEMIAAAGFKWIRQEFPWEDIEIHGPGDTTDRRHDPPRSAWEKYDQIVDLCQAHDIQIIARLSTPPDWSRRAGKQKGAFAPPDDLNDYGNFVEAVMRRYRGRIHYYQIWNEPNIYPEWGEQPVNALEYVELLKVGYTRAKAADPDVVIIAGALAATIELDRYPHGLADALFLQQMYDAGAAPYFDVLSMQGYGLWSGPTDRRMQPRIINFSRPLYIRDIMVRNGDAHKPIWLSEMAWNALPPESTLPPAYGRVTPEQQARYAVLAYQRLQSEWPWAGVATYWFLKQADERERDENPQYYFRLLEPDFTPLPAYAALRAAAHAAPVMYRGYHQEDHWSITYSDGWRTCADSQAVLGRYRQATRAGAQALFTFGGTDLWLAAYPAGGQIDVTIDGGTALRVQLPDQSVVGTRVAIARGLPPGQHAISLTVQPDALGRLPGIDGLIVADTPWQWWLRRVLGGLALVAGLAGLVWSTVQAVSGTTRDFAESE